MKYELITNLRIIPGTEGILVPDYDNTASKEIEKKKRLDWDDNFSGIEEIQQLKKGDIVIDAGAWIGDSTEVFLKKGCIVHAFEPRSDNFICLLNNCPYAQCYNIALGTGENYGTDRRGGNTGGYPLIGGNKITFRLDSFWKGRLAFLKIDVEGYEAEVLRGGYLTIKNLHPTIHIEINPFALAQFGETAESITNIFIDLGYKNFREVYRYKEITGQEHWDIIAK